jgi:hypothetical protein
MATKEHRYIDPNLIFENYEGANAGPGNLHHCIVCPECGYNYVHIDSVMIGQEKASILVSCNAARTIPNKGKTGRRGSAIRIPMWCEEGHRFAVTMQFHKGQTYFDVESFGMDDEDVEHFTELWRD